MVRLSLSKVMVRLCSAPAGGHGQLFFLGEPGHLDLQVTKREGEADPLGKVRRHGVGGLEQLTDIVEQPEIGVIERLIG